MPARIAATAPAALEVAALSHSFGGRKVLDDASFEVHPGDFSVLLGLNGAGKTTLFALVTRLYHANRGRISVFGADMRRHPGAALARIGVVFQQPTLDLDLTVEQNLFYHAALHGLSRAAAAPRIAAEVERVGLSARGRDRVRLLSGGQRRRVELARALIHDPALLLLDEPTVGLDISRRCAMHARCRSASKGGSGSTRGRWAAVRIKFLPRIRQRAARPTKRRSVLSATRPYCRSGRVIPGER